MLGTSSSGFEGEPLWMAPSPTQNRYGLPQLQSSNTSNRQHRAGLDQEDGRVRVVIRHAAKADEIVVEPVETVVFQAVLLEVQDLHPRRRSTGYRNSRHNRCERCRKWCSRGSARRRRIRRTRRRRRRDRARTPRRCQRCCDAPRRRIPAPIPEHRRPRSRCRSPLARARVRRPELQQGTGESFRAPHLRALPGRKTDCPTDGVRARDRGRSRGAVPANRGQSGVRRGRARCVVVPRGARGAHWSCGALEDEPARACPGRAWSGDWAWGRNAGRADATARGAPRHAGRSGARAPQPAPARAAPPERRYALLTAPARPVCARRRDGAAAPGRIGSELAARRVTRPRSRTT